MWDRALYDIFNPEKNIKNLRYKKKKSLQSPQYIYIYNDKNITIQLNLSERKVKVVREGKTHKMTKKGR